MPKMHDCVRHFFSITPIIVPLYARGNKDNRGGSAKNFYSVVNFFFQLVISPMIFYRFGKRFDGQYREQKPSHYFVLVLMPIGSFSQPFSASNTVFAEKDASPTIGNKENNSFFKRCWSLQDPPVSTERVVGVADDDDCCWYHSKNGENY
jgi:hypothetical protein